MTFPQLGTVKPSGNNKSVFMSLTFSTVSDTESHQCNWCQNASFGVAPTTRLDAHHNSQATGAVQPFKMCASCVCRRVDILTCQRHRLINLPEDPNRPLYLEEDQLNEYLNASDGNLQLPFAWCSVCPRPAHFKCCTQNPFKATAEPGCGLKLCTKCLVCLRTSSQNDLTALIAYRQEGTDSSGLGARGDAWMLRADSQFMEEVERRVEFEQAIESLSLDDQGGA